MKKQVIISAIIMLLSISMLASLVPLGFALHSADIMWIKNPKGDQVVFTKDKTNDTLSTRWNDLYTVFSPSPKDHKTGFQKNAAIFSVTNNGVDKILTVEVGIEQDKDGYAYFYLNETKVTAKDLVRPATDWHYETIEYDPNLEVRSFRYVSQNGLGPGETIAIWMYFRGGPEFCNYRFSIRTIDNGRPQYSYRHDLYLVMDNFPPIISAFKPANGATVDGLPLPCGNHYFAIDIVAKDTVECSSGISGANYWVEVWSLSLGQTIQSFSGQIRNETGLGYWVKYLRRNDTMQAHFEVKAYETTIGDLPEGYYNISVTVKDRVGNSVAEVHKIKYVPPPIPEFTASPNTWIKDKDKLTGLVSSEQVVYKNKILGSSVTLTDTGFRLNTKVDFRIYIPTYISYNYTYRTFNVLVNSTTAKEGGLVTGTFIFPKAPQGTYTVYITGTGADGTPLTKYKTVKVVCEIIFNPNEVIGPAVIDVMATGLRYPARESPVPTTYLLVREQSWVNPKDAIMGINQHIPMNWYIDYNGTLQNWITKITGIKGIAPGFTMPILQPGTYEITLLVQGEFYYWHCITWGPPLTYTSQTNTIKVVSTLDLLPTIAQRLDELKPIITRIDGNVVAIKTTVGQIDTTLTELKPVITRIDGNVVTINTTVGTIRGTITTIKDDVAHIKTNEGWDVRVNTKDLGGVTQAATDSKRAAEGLTMPVYLAVIFSLVAAVIAAICTVLVYRKIA